MGGSRDGTASSGYGYAAATSGLRIPEADDPSPCFWRRQIPKQSHKAPGCMFPFSGQVRNHLLLAIRPCLPLMPYQRKDQVECAKYQRSPREVSHPSNDVGWGVFALAGPNLLLPFVQHKAPLSKSWATRFVQVSFLTQALRVRGKRRWHLGPANLPHPQHPRHMDVEL